MSLCVLAIGAHPDDVELRVGGTIHKLARRGHRVVILDLTRGEAATRGSVELRAQEAERARKELGVRERINLGLPDGGVEDSVEGRGAVIEVIRRVRPEVVLCHHWVDLHPDHAAAGSLLRSAFYASGLGKLAVPGGPWRPRAVLFYMTHVPFEPSFIVDTSGHFEAKRKAILCYSSQLFDPGYEGPPTRVGKEGLLEEIRARDRYFGSLIEKEYGEPFRVLTPLPMDDPAAFFCAF